MAKHYFKYSDVEKEYLSGKDKRLSEVIAKVGHIDREVNPDLFGSLIHSIIGQQISTKAHATIWLRMVEGLGEITPMSICSQSPQYLQSYGLSFRKVEYMKSVSQKIENGEFIISALYDMSDEEVCRELSKLTGIGVWTAEMMMIFSMQRSNIMSYGDLAIHRGMRMIFRHRKITKELFAKYHRRFSPYATVASLYFWAVAGGAIPELIDPAPKPKSKKKCQRTIRK